MVNDGKDDFNVYQFDTKEPKIDKKKLTFIILIILGIICILLICNNISNTMRSYQVYKQYEENKQYEEGMENLQVFSKLISPSTYIGPIFNNNNKSYLDNVLSGEGTGNIVSNIMIDLLTPLSVNKVSKVI